MSERMTDNMTDITLKKEEIEELSDKYKQLIARLDTTETELIPVQDVKQLVHQLMSKVVPDLVQNGDNCLLIDNQSSDSSVVSFDDLSDTPDTDSDSDYRMNARSRGQSNRNTVSKYDKLLKDFRLKCQPKVDLIKLDKVITETAADDTTAASDSVKELEDILYKYLNSKGVICRKMKTTKQNERQNKSSDEESDSDHKLKRLCRIPRITRKANAKNGSGLKNGEISDEILSDSDSPNQRPMPKRKKKKKTSTPKKNGVNSDLESDCDVSQIRTNSKNFISKPSERNVDVLGSDVSSDEEMEKKPKADKKNEKKKVENDKIVSDEDIEVDEDIEPESDVEKSMNKTLRNVKSVPNNSEDKTINIDSNSEDEVIVKRNKKTPKRRMSDDEDFNDEVSDKESSDDSSVMEDSSGMDPSAPDSDNSDSDSKSRKKKKNSSKSRKNGKTKRRRVKVNDSSDDDCKVLSDDEKESPNTSRKKIRKIISDKKIKQQTKDAAEAERDRMKRIKEKQKEYNDLIKTRSLKSSEVKELILEFDKETKEPLVQVDETLVKFLKPHQLNGIEFMYNCMIETIDQLETSEGSGCILAHSMGLGKTLQVITFLYTILTHDRIKKHIKRALVIAPVNTIKNWANEFRIWLNDNDLDDLLVFEMFEAKTMAQRAEILRIWHKRGGVMIIGLTLFSSLVMGGRGKKPPKYVRDAIQECLLDPGPEVVICDEGHLLKNEKTAYNKAVMKLKSLRRAVLTGTPLQNNLNEYHVMVDFVKPSLLGTRKEFTNRFVNPITNGQHEDSTDYDVKIMKKRVHILHTLLNGCVHRCDYSVLVPYLQPKHEYVISVMLTEKQIELYSYYLQNMTDKAKLSLLADYGSLRLIWNHPILLFEQHRRRLEKQNEESMDEFIDDDDEVDTPASGDSDIECITDAGTSKALPKRRMRTRNHKTEDGEESEIDTKSVGSEDNLSDAWFAPMLKKDEAKEIELSGKFILLFAILEECEKMGDKILLFSQSLDTLDLVEEMLKIRMDRAVAESKSDETKETTNIWIKNRDYFRLDGSTASDYRKQWIDVFNDEKNYRARLFLISTKAGGLGINLVGANRCIIFDASWNPTHDVQAIFRIFRFGQKKPVYVYRFVAQGSMEEKIYERQIIKQSLSCRVVDEQSIQRHFKASELSELYVFKPDKQKDRPTPKLPKDRLLAEILIKHKDFVVNYHEHDSLLENRPEEDMTEDEKMAAWNEYEQEKDALFLREQQEREARIQREFLYAQAQSQAQAQQQFQQQQTDAYAQMLRQMQMNNQGNPAVNYENLLTTQIYQQIMRQQQAARQQSQQRYQEARAQKLRELAQQSDNVKSGALPGYDKMTVEDIGSYVKTLNPKLDNIGVVQQIFRIIETGLTTCTSQLNGAKEKLNTDNTPEVRANYEKLAKEVFNLNMQKNRAQTLFKPTMFNQRAGPSILRQNNPMGAASTSSAAKTADQLIEEVD